MENIVIVQSKNRLIESNRTIDWQIIINIFLNAPVKSSHLCFPLSASCKAPNMDVSLIQNKQFVPKETLVYVRLVEFALQALDIYTINVTAAGQAVVKPAAWVILLSYVFWKKQSCPLPMKQRIREQMVC